MLADFDTTPMGEMEVTAFQAAASTLPGATLGFIGAVSIFQTGLLPSLVVPPGYSHALEEPGGPEGSPTPSNAVAPVKGMCSARSISLLWLTKLFLLSAKVGASPEKQISRRANGP